MTPIYPTIKLNEMWQKPRITVVKPRSGNVWFIGERYEIVWDKFNFTNPTRVNIGLTKEHYGIVRVIAESVLNSGTYSWMVPNLPEGQYQVGVATVNNKVFDLSDRFLIKEHFEVPKETHPLAAGPTSSFASVYGGRVKAWGLQYYPGFLGDGISSLPDGSPIPVDVFYLYNGVAQQYLAGITDISAGFNHVLALDEVGTIWGWGCNQHQELGINSGDEKFATRIYLSSQSEAAHKIAAGRYSFAISDLDRKLYAWGEPDFGSAPTQFLFDKCFKAISASSHALAVDINGKVWGTGANDFGQLGNGNTIDKDGIFDQVSGIGDVVEVAAGANHSLALKKDGTLMAWGRNTEGQLGDGTTTRRTTPVMVNGLTRIVAIAAGNNSSFAIKSLPSIYGNNRYILFAWGQNYGNFGNGTITGAILPQYVLNDIIVIATSNCDHHTTGAHSLFLKENGQIWASGGNDKGQLGDETHTDRSTAAPVLNLA